MAQNELRGDFGSLARHACSAVVGPGDCEGFAVNVQPAGGLLEFLQRVPDARGRLGRRHPLSAMLAAVVCATLCGFRGTRHGEHRAEQVLVRIQHMLAKVLSSTAIPSDTNESKTAYDLVRRLMLKGKLIVGDAADCQREICEAIVEQEADTS